MLMIFRSKWYTQINKQTTKQILNSLHVWPTKDSHDGSDVGKMGFPSSPESDAVFADVRDGRSSLELQEHG